MENVENLMLEHLRTIRADVTTIKEDVKELKARIGHVEISIAGIRRDIAHADEQAAALRGH